MGWGARLVQATNLLYVLKYKYEIAILWIHLYDGQICASGMDIIKHIWHALKQSLDFFWQEKVKQIVGIKFEDHEKGIFLWKPIWTRNLLSQHGFTMLLVTTSMVAVLQLETAKAGEVLVDVSKYLSKICSLCYLALGTQPDLAFTVNYLGKFLAFPQAENWTVVKHFLRYLSSTKEESLHLYGNVNGKLGLYCDANWGGEGSW